MRKAMRKSKKRDKIIEKLKLSGLITAEDLALKLPEIDKATIYRNINRFVSEGIVREIRIKKGVSSYEIVHDSHQHLICTNCEEIRKVAVDLKKIKKLLLDGNSWLKGYEIEDIEINVRAKARKQCKKLAKKAG